MIENNNAFKKTRRAFMWMNILNTPFWAIFNMLPYILYKELHATAFQITTIIVLKPAVSLLAIYWSSLIEKRRDRLLSNLIIARVLSHLPFLFFPFVDNVWYFILSFGFYMMLARGTVPAWMEVLKLNLPGISREKIFAMGSAFAYFGAALIPFALGEIMDSYMEAWRYIFPITALISTSAIFFKSLIPIKIEENKDETKIDTQAISFSIKNFTNELIKPWKSAYHLLLRRADFASYQLGFMIGGAGLIIMQPALPVFFMDGLNLTYTELAVALTFFKGIGYALSSPGWAKLLTKIDIFKFNSKVTSLAFIFPFFLIAAQYNLFWLYAGYLLYGCMQGGSEMSWNLSGPIFSKDEESCAYSSVNVLTVGLRGCVIPILGNLALGFMMPTQVMLIGSLLCLISAVLMARYSRIVKPLPTI